MPPFDRDGALKTAEKALRQGRVDAAIAEYVKIIAAQPRDWNSANALGDLYVRAGQKDTGIAHYTRIAEHLAHEGFYPKAAALYKKIVKIKPTEEAAFLQLGEIAARQGLLADAKQYFEQVATFRRARGDRKGEAELKVRLGTLDPEDLDARLTAARAAAEMGDLATAVFEFKDVAARLDKLDRPAEAVVALQAAYDLEPDDEATRQRLVQAYLDGGALADAHKVAQGPAELKRIAAAYDRAGKPELVLELLAEVVDLDPDDVGVRAELAQAYAAKGELDRARTFLTPESAGQNAGLWITLGEIELRGGRLDDGRAAIVEALRLDPRQRDAAVVLGCRLAEVAPEAGYRCIDAVADSALEQRDYAVAAAALQEFVTRVRNHLVALMRLVDICVDGGLEATMYEAQAQLADAYLEVNRGLEARIISEDLVAREPWNRANIERFRRALVMLGEEDPDGVIAERLSGESPFMSTDRMDLNEGFDFSAEAEAEDVVKIVVAPPVVEGSLRHDDDADEVDLSDALDDDDDNEGSQDVMSDEQAAEQYRLALGFYDMGMTADAIVALERASRSPRQRFDAAAMLGRLNLEQHDVTNALRWFESAAAASAPTPDAGRALLYDLAAALEAAGERSRALAVFVELEAESAGFRDVARRIERLSTTKTRG